MLTEVEAALANRACVGSGDDCRSSLSRREQGGIGVEGRKRGIASCRRQQQYGALHASVLKTLEQIALLSARPRVSDPTKNAHRHGVWVSPGLRDHLPVTRQNRQRVEVEAALANEECVRALAQLAERDARGETLVVVDGQRLRDHLQRQVDALPLVQARRKIEELRPLLEAPAIQPITDPSVSIAATNLVVGEATSPVAVEPAHSDDKVAAAAVANPTIADLHMAMAAPWLDLLSSD